MKAKQIGFCRVTQSLVTDSKILDIPYLQDDMDVYSKTSMGPWKVWAPEYQCYKIIHENEVPDVVKMGVMLL
jgi:hypothetical protein